MYTDPVLNIPAVYELRQLAQLVLRDDRPCLNCNIVEVAGGLAEVPGLLPESAAMRLRAIAHPAAPREKLAAVVGMARQAVEPLAGKGAEHQKAADAYLAGLEEAASLQVPQTSLDPPALIRLGMMVVEELAGRLAGCRLALIHGSLARGQADCLSDVDGDFFFEAASDHEQIRQALAAGPREIHDVQVGRQDLSFWADGVEFRCDLWDLARVQQYLAGWPAFQAGWPWDYLCEQLPEALFVAGDRGLFERLRETILRPPEALKQSLFAGQRQDCRGCLEQMARCGEADDVVGFFATLNGRFTGWVSHWAKCLFISNDLFIDVPKRLILRSDDLGRKPARTGARLQRLFRLDLSSEGMREVLRICRELTEEVGQ
jgi:hypothetical protein